RRVLFRSNVEIIARVQIADILQINQVEMMRKLPIGFPSKSIFPGEVLFVQTDIVLRADAGTKGGKGRHAFGNDALNVEGQDYFRKIQIDIGPDFRDIKKTILFVHRGVFGRSYTRPCPDLKGFQAVKYIADQKRSPQPEPQILDVAP